MKKPNITTGQNLIKRATFFGDTTENQVEDINPSSQNVTLLDMFAGQAMIALAGNYTGNFNLGEKAYALAAQMLEARGKYIEETNE